ncbi:MAG: hypothetical protein FJX29_11865, partial [Alphaproteobacteria bacterium]|nr:hypothetical protein [Alphaproteobacteria bacterium]
MTSGERPADNLASPAYGDKPDAAAAAPGSPVFGNRDRRREPPVIDAAPGEVRDETPPTQESEKES